jgi:hypothetical protein
MRSSIPACGLPWLLHLSKDHAGEEVHGILNSLFPCMPLQKFAIPSVSLKMFGELQRHCSKLFFFAFHATTVILDSNGVKVQV